jgi:hypothetical protein
MTRLLTLTAALCVFSVASAAPPEKFTFVDIQPHANQKLKEPFGGGDGNDLAALGKDGRTLAGVNFKIGAGAIQLTSKLLAVKRPTKVEGIKVGQVGVKLHFLHATEFGNGSKIGQEGKEGDPLFVADGTTIAEYKVHYEDGKTETIPVVYGQDVRDWWFTEGTKGVTRGKVAWLGDNEMAKENKCRIRLYLTTWENPPPAKKIASIDYVRMGDSPAAPFCVAITVEAK